MRREVWIRKIIPGLIFLSLWLAGGREVWFFPLILLPGFYVVVVEKKGLHLLGFSRRELRYSIIMGLLIALFLIVMYYPIFLHYLPDILKRDPLNLYRVLIDVIWYPVYEEITYRSFTLTYFADFNRSYLSTRNLIVNLVQTLLFVSIHTHYFSTPLMLAPLFLLGLLNGFLFQKTRNIYGCITSHSVLNGFALLRFFRVVLV